MIPALTFASGAAVMAGVLIQSEIRAFFVIVGAIMMISAIALHVNGLT